MYITLRSGIYTIVNLSNGKQYIGSSIDTTKRWWEHSCNLRRGKHYNPHLQRSWDSYGIDNFSFEVLEYCDPDILLEREDWWIDLLQTRDDTKGYNIASATRRMLGYKHSIESREKISAAGRKRKGIPKSLEMRAKLSKSKMGNKSHLGILHTPETKAKIGAAHKGMKHTEDTKAKMSATKKSRRENMRS